MHWDFLFVRHWIVSKLMPQWSQRVRAHRHTPSIQFFSTAKITCKSSWYTFGQNILKVFFAMGSVSKKNLGYKLPKKQMWKWNTKIINSFSLFLFLACSSARMYVWARNGLLANALLEQKNRLSVSLSVRLAFFIEIVPVYSWMSLYVCLYVFTVQYSLFCLCFTTYEKFFSPNVFHDADN
jgi:hypothetical protein